MLTVEEIYNSIMGDGLLSGQPTTFVNFGSVNKFTSPISVAGLVENYLEPNFSKAVATCLVGEVCKQPEVELLALIRALHTFNRVVSAEVDGSVWMPEVIHDLDWITLKPYMYQHPKYVETLNHFMYGAHQKMQVRFEIESMEEFQRVYEFVEKFYNEFRKWRLPLILVPYENNFSLGRAIASVATNTDLNVRVMVQSNLLLSEG